MGLTQNDVSAPDPGILFAKIQRTLEFDPRATALTGLRTAVDFFPIATMLRPMNTLDHLLERNRRWAHSMVAGDAAFFDRLSQQQAPRYLWIGCSDSRVPANQIIGLNPGEIFVHRNVANVVVHADLNCLSAIQFAVDLLKVEHIIVCGHFDCSGVRAVLEGRRVGLADNWLRHVGDVANKHSASLDAAPAAQRANLLAEFNVVEQVENVCQTTVVRDAWDRGQALTVHGWLYGLRDGHIRDLRLAIESPDDLAERYPAALERVGLR
jgi:carbonic anhydrase